MNEGDALSHVARFERPKRVASQVEDFQDDLEDSCGIWEHLRSVTFEWGT